VLFPVFSVYLPEYPPKDLQELAPPRSTEWPARTCLKTALPGSSRTPVKPTTVCFPSALASVPSVLLLMTSLSFPLEKGHRFSFPSRDRDPAFHHCLRCILAGSIGPFTVYLERSPCFTDLFSTRLPAGFIETILDIRASAPLHSSPHNGRFFPALPPVRLPPSVFNSSGFPPSSFNFCTPFSSRSGLSGSFQPPG